PPSPVPPGPATAPGPGRPAAALRTDAGARHAAIARPARALPRSPTRPAGPAPRRQQPCCLSRAALTEDRPSPPPSVTSSSIGVITITPAQRVPCRRSHGLGGGPGGNRPGG